MSAGRRSRRSSSPTCTGTSGFRRASSVCSPEPWRRSANSGRTSSSRTPTSAGISRCIARETCDVWLLAWQPEQDTDWHDHGGSSGSFCVADGVLLEQLRTGGGHRVRTRRLSASERIFFGPAHVHNVSHSGTAPAVSVHAYSPPLVTMTYYELTPGGLVANETVVVTSPEGPRRELRRHRSLQSVDDLLADARLGIERVGPEAAYRADGRRRDAGRHPARRNSAARRARFRTRSSSGATCSSGGSIPEATPASWSWPATTAQIIVLCSEGYASSLAAASLRHLGLRRATDVDGGFRAWRQPVCPPRRVTGRLTGASERDSRDRRARPRLSPRVAAVARLGRRGDRHRLRAVNASRPPGAGGASRRWRGVTSTAGRPASEPSCSSRWRPTTPGVTRLRCCGAMPAGSAAVLGPAEVRALLRRTCESAPRRWCGHRPSVVDAIVAALESGATPVVHAARRDRDRRPDGSGRGRASRSRARAPGTTTLRRRRSSSASATVSPSCRAMPAPSGVRRCSPPTRLALLASADAVVAFEHARLRWEHRRPSIPACMRPARSAGRRSRRAVCARSSATRLRPRAAACRIPSACAARRSSTARLRTPSTG